MSAHIRIHMPTDMSRHMSIHMSIHAWLLCAALPAFGNGFPYATWPFMSVLVSVYIFMYLPLPSFLAARSCTWRHSTAQTTAAPNTARL